MPKSAIELLKRELKAKGAELLDVYAMRGRSVFRVKIGQRVVLVESKKSPQGLTREEIPSLAAEILSRAAEGARS